MTPTTVFDLRAVRRIRLAFKLLLAMGLVLAAATTALAASEDDREGGIGGTGIYFGPISRLGSIVVNGDRIAVPGTVRAGSAISVPLSTAVRPGETVFVTTRQGANGPVADRITRFYPIIGKPDWSRSSGANLRIMGTRVRLNAGALIVNAQGKTMARNAIPQDATIAVSGLWRNGIVRATRLTILPNADIFAISGQVGINGGPVIGSTRIAGARLRAGDFATVVGTASGSRLSATNATRGFSRYAPFDGQKRLSASAYLAPDPDGRGYHLSGFGIPMDPKSTVSRATSTLSVFVGTYDGTFLINERR